MSDWHELIATYPWNTPSTADAPLGNPITMLSLNERRLLHWLAREFDLSRDDTIVDLGCFLGGSTVSLAAGIQHNPHFSEGQVRIHSYDIFAVPDDETYLRYIGHDLRPGMSTLPLFLEALGDARKDVFIHCGDFMFASAPPGPIGILFVDIAKNWELNDVVVSRFFSRLVPGRSLVVQQDYNDHSCPWINVTMGLFRDYFRVLCDDHCSRVYLYERELPPSSLGVAIREQINPRDMVALMEQVVRSEPNQHSRFFSYVTTAWLVAEADGLAAARKYLARCDSVAGFAWPEAWKYIDMVNAAIEIVHNRRDPRDKGLTFCEQDERPCR